MEKSSTYLAKFRLNVYFISIEIQIKFLNKIPVEHKFHLTMIYCISFWNMAWQVEFTAKLSISNSPHIRGPNPTIFWSYWDSLIDVVCPQEEATPSHTLLYAAARFPSLENKVLYVYVMFLIRTNGWCAEVMALQGSIGVPALSNWKAFLPEVTHFMLEMCAFFF